jgi:hypothetical protein
MDPWENHLHKKKLVLLKKSWAGIFRERFLHKLPVAKLKKYFSKKMGRPTKELVTTVGACALQQFFDLTDAETREQLAFNIQWHYALDTLEQDDQILSLKTLWTIRQLLTQEGLAKKIFDDVSEELANAYGVDTRLQRLDSVHIHSNMARLGRVRLLARVCTLFLKNLKRHQPTLYKTISRDITTRYIKNEDPDYFGNAKPSQSQKRLQDLAGDIFELIEQFKEQPSVVAMHTYKTLQRVFSEQCSIENEQVVVKVAKEVPSDSLQNPSDADATYDGHKGQGYQVQIMETYSKKSDEKEQKPKLELITYVDVEPAHCHDSGALVPALKQTRQRNMLPKELSTDTSYGSQDNMEKAKKQNVELVAPTPGRKPKKNLSDFEFDPNTHHIMQCPEKHKPETIKHNAKDSMTAVWDKNVCEQCPGRESCAVKKGKKGYLLNYTPKEVRGALRRQYEQTEEFRQKYRYRSGIEATNSRYIHMTGARRLRYRGLSRVDYAARLKALGINLFRTAKHVLNHPENIRFA